jgi:hypothetical protein
MGGGKVRFFSILTKVRKNQVSHLVFFMKKEAK